MSARILVVDDSLTIRRALEMILEPAGYDLRLAESGKEALAAACKRAKAIELQTNTQQSCKRTRWHAFHCSPQA